MNLEDYTQPFWVGHNNPRFPTARNGYLPALEPKEIAKEAEEIESKIIHYHFRLPVASKRKTKY